MTETDTHPDAGAAACPSTARARRCRARRKAGTRLVTVELTEAQLARLVGDPAAPAQAIGAAIESAIGYACPPPPAPGALRVRITLPHAYIAAMVRLGWLHEADAADPAAVMAAFERIGTHVVRVGLSPTTTRVW
jgi:hypothetical protein